MLNVIGLEVDAVAPTRVYATASGVGVLHTATGGQLWSSTGSPLDAVGIAVSRVGNESALYTITSCGHLFKSVDSGVSWTEIVSFPPSQVQCAGAVASSIVADPSDSAGQTLYVSVAGEGLFRSQNAGVDWSRIPILDASGIHELPVIALAIASNGVLYAGLDLGQVTRISGGAANPPTTVPSTLNVTAVATGFDGSIVLAGLADGSARRIVDRTSRR